jgi:hypothetical protein
MAAAGYLASHAPLYVKRFLAGSLAVYEVTREFPRIRTSDVPRGVVGVRVALSLPLLAPFAAAADRIVGERVPETELV